MLEQLSKFFDQDPKRQEDYQDFGRRYQENPEGLSDEEAARRYREMMAHAGDDDQETQESYEKAFGRVSERERRALAERYREATRDSRRPYEGFEHDQDLDAASSPRELGRMTRKAAQQDPDLLEQIVGPNSPLSGTAGRVALAGMAAFAAQRFLGRK